MRNLLIAAAVAFGGLTAAAMASEAVPQSLAEHLDKAPAEFTQSAASQRRHMIMEETMRQQRRDQYRGGGYGRGPGYGRGYGPGPRYYGPHPGYRRPPPPYGYGPRW
ncbi:hypothetical protein [Bosea sp. NBC_00550]|uniref:hypothetical protein n=1 Tax=Bosea sp. NBC_00550 TaxID=2969621 RepID=UPI00222E2271|nr:hypothetical protein [Bosea sp. NBC_00550]UZF95590.1 hypothetical protein NWE53_29450 [Bosea sp. NBC_00550]